MSLLLTILSGTLQALAAYLGVHMAIDPPATPKQRQTYKFGFIAIGFLGISITVAQQIQNNRDEDRLQKQLSDIQKSVHELPALAFGAAAQKEASPSPVEPQSATKSPSPQRRLPSPPVSTTPPEPTQGTTIAKFVAETRLTCKLRGGAEIPPTSVDWMPLGPSNAIVAGTGGEFPLKFVSPVVFARQESGRIVVINRFVASGDSDVVARPLGFLTTLKIVTVQPHFIVYAGSFESCELFEMSITVNDSPPWYYPYRLPPTPFPPGQTPIIKVPLDGLSAVVTRQQR